MYYNFDNHILMICLFFIINRHTSYKYMPNKNKIIPTELFSSELLQVIKKHIIYILHIICIM